MIVNEKDRVQNEKHIEVLKRNVEERKLLAQQKKGVEKIRIENEAQIR